MASMISGGGGSGSNKIGMRFVPSISPITGDDKTGDWYATNQDQGGSYVIKKNLEDVSNLVDDDKDDYYFVQYYSIMNTSSPQSTNVRVRIYTYHAETETFDDDYALFTYTSSTYRAMPDRAMKALCDHFLRCNLSVGNSTHGFRTRFAFNRENNVCAGVDDCSMNSTNNYYSEFIYKWNKTGALIYNTSQDQGKAYTRNIPTQEILAYRDIPSYSNFGYYDEEKDVYYSIVQMTNGTAASSWSKIAYFYHTIKGMGEDSTTITFNSDTDTLIANLDAGTNFTPFTPWMMYRKGKYVYIVGCPSAVLPIINITMYFNGFFIIDTENETVEYRNLGNTKYRYNQSSQGREFRLFGSILPIAMSTINKWNLTYYIMNGKVYYGYGYYMWLNVGQAVADLNEGAQGVKSIAEANHMEEDEDTIEFYAPTNGVDTSGRFEYDWDYIPSTQVPINEFTGNTETNGMKSMNNIYFGNKLFLFFSRAPFIYTGISTSRRYDTALIIDDAWAKVK